MRPDKDITDCPVPGSIIIFSSQPVAQAVEISELGKMLVPGLGPDPVVGELDNRRLAISRGLRRRVGAVLVDAVVETHDRLVGRTYRDAALACEAQLGDETAAVRDALRA